VAKFFLFFCAVARVFVVVVVACVTMCTTAATATVHRKKFVIINISGKLKKKCLTEKYASIP